MSVEVTGCADWRLLVEMTEFRDERVSVEMTECTIDGCLNGNNLQHDRFSNSELQRRR